MDWAEMTNDELEVSYNTAYCLYLDYAFKHDSSMADLYWNQVEEIDEELKRRGT